ncbi:MAG: PH domain-containing protein [Myxococcales bacterium]|nr:PH domain-containing protein [Myxococcales bacterium]
MEENIPVGVAGRVRMGAADPGPEQVLFEGSPAVVPSFWVLLICIVTVGLALIYFYFRQTNRRYRITTQRIVVDTGLFSKRLEQVDIYRITDYSVERPFFQRIMGTGNIYLEAMDKSTPHLRLVGLKTDVVKLYEALRHATETAKRSRAVAIVDNE